MRQDFVTFYSPGTFVAETTTKEIESWDVDAAKTMAAEIKDEPRWLSPSFMNCAIGC